MIVLKRLRFRLPELIAATEKPAPRIQRIAVAVDDDVVSFAICENSVRIFSDDELVIDLV